MKKVFYSIYMKIAISILCVLSILCAVTIGTDGIKQWQVGERLLSMSFLS